MSATTPRATATGPTTELASPAARAIVEHPEHLTIAAHRVLTVLALERIRRTGNEFTVKELAEAARLPADVIGEARAVLRCLELACSSPASPLSPPVTPTTRSTRPLRRWQAAASSRRAHPR